MEIVCNKRLALMAQELSSDQAFQQPAAFEPIRRPTLREVVADRIRTAIFKGAIIPGDRIVESTLAKTFGVAQSTMREAVTDLVGEGFLVKQVNRGTRVRSLDPQVLRALFDVRMHLEPLAAKMAAKRIGASECEQLSEHVEVMRRTASNDHAAFYQVDIAFHKGLSAATGNEFLVQTMKPLTICPIAYILAGLRSVQQVDFRASAEDHAAIVELLQSRDSEGLEAVMREKIASWHECQLSERHRTRLYHR